MIRKQTTIQDAYDFYFKWGEAEYCKVPAMKNLYKAKYALVKYMEEHHLDPLIDYRQHPKYGQELTALVQKLNLERDKILDQHPYNNIKKVMRFLKLRKKKEMKKLKLKKAKALEIKEGIAPIAKPRKKLERTAPLRYDYPLIDGREMDAKEKKAYRAAQRALKNGKKPREKKQKVEEPTKPSPKGEIPIRPLPKLSKKEAKKKKNRIED